MILLSCNKILNIRFIFVNVLIHTCLSSSDYCNFVMEIQGMETATSMCDTNFKKERIGKTCAQRQKEYRMRKKIEKQLQNPKKIPKTNAEYSQQYRKNLKNKQLSETIILARRKKNAERAKRYRERLKLKKQHAEFDSSLSSKEDSLMTVLIKNEKEIDNHHDSNCEELIENQCQIQTNHILPSMNNDTQHLPLPPLVTFKDRFNRITPDDMKEPIVSDFVVVRLKVEPHSDEESDTKLSSVNYDKEEKTGLDNETGTPPPDFEVIKVEPDHGQDSGTNFSNVSYDKGENKAGMDREIKTSPPGSAIIIKMEPDYDQDSNAKPSNVNYENGENKLDVDDAIRPSAPDFAMFKVKPNYDQKSELEESVGEERNVWSPTSSVPDIFDFDNVWSSTPFVPDISDFDNSVAGVLTKNVNLHSESTEIDCFMHFFGTEVVSKLVEFINDQHQKNIRESDVRLHSRIENRRKVTVAEMYIFLAVTFLFTRNKHLTIDEHWSTDPLLQSPIFSKTMSRNRYTAILGLLRFSPPNIDSSHILKDVSPLANEVKKTFRKTLVPHRDLCVYESIMPFKGYSSNEQYMPNKRNRFGVKLFILCDIKTKLIIDFNIHCGAGTEIEDADNLGIAGAAVNTLLKNLMHEHRRLYADHWFSSPKLFQYLYHHQIYACGTVALDRLKKDGVTDFKSLKKGEINAKYKRPLMALKYKDKTDIYMLSTFHTAVFKPTTKCNRETGLSNMKPEVLIDYNSKKASTVDNTDMLLNSVQCIRKSKVWQKKLGLHLVDLCMLNAHAVYKILHNNKKSLADFQLGVVRQLIEKYKAHELEHSAPTSSQSLPALRLSAARLAGHMPDYTQGKKSRPCFVCQHTTLRKRCRKESRFFCQVCQVTLCVTPCFKIYHKDEVF